MRRDEDSASEGQKEEKNLSYALAFPSFSARLVIRLKTLLNLLAAYLLRHKTEDSRTAVAIARTALRVESVRGSSILACGRAR